MEAQGRDPAYGKEASPADYHLLVEEPSANCRPTSIDQRRSTTTRWHTTAIPKSR